MKRLFLLTTLFITNAIKPSYWPTATALKKATALGLFSGAGYEWGKQIKTFSDVPSQEQICDYNTQRLEKTGAPLPFQQLGMEKTGGLFQQIVEGTPAARILPYVNPTGLSLTQDVVTNTAVVVGLQTLNTKGNPFRNYWQILTNKPETQIHVARSARFDKWVTQPSRKFAPYCLVGSAFLTAVEAGQFGYNLGVVLGTSKKEIDVKNLGEKATLGTAGTSAAFGTYALARNVAQNVSIKRDAKKFIKTHKDPRCVHDYVQIFSEQLDKQKPYGKQALKGLKVMATSLGALALLAYSNF